MKIFLLLTLCVVIPCLAWMPSAPHEYTKQAIVEPTDSTSPPTIGFTPKFLTLTKKDTSQFLVAEIGILNRGGAPLHITKVTPSCGCAAATILKNPISPLDLGKVRIQINTINIKDSLMRVEYVFESDAETSPSIYSVWVRNPNAVK